MLEQIPDEAALTALLGAPLYQVWAGLRHEIEALYDMDCLWNNGGKRWTYEYKYRRGGKTLCALYAKENCMGLMLIFGMQEREAFEQQRECFSPKTQAVYDAATTYHDGKWVMFTPADLSAMSDYLNLLRLKRRPNRKIPTRALTSDKGV